MGKQAATDGRTRTTDQELRAWKRALKGEFTQPANRQERRLIQKLRSKKGKKLD